MSFEKFENNNESKEKDGTLDEQAGKKGILDKFKDIFGGKQEKDEPNEESSGASEKLAKQKSDFEERLKVTLSDNGDQIKSDFNNNETEEDDPDKGQRVREQNPARDDGDER